MHFRSYAVEVVIIKKLTSFSNLQNSFPKFIMYFFQKLIIALCIAAYYAAAATLLNSETLIIGGENAEKNEFPWLVHFEVSIEEGQSRFCSGSLIDFDHVLTSASCVIGIESPITVSAGDHSLTEIDGTEQEITSQEVIIHDNFNSGDNLENDIAIIRLNSSLNESEAVKPIGLPSSALDPEFAGHGIAAGWGEFSTSNETEGQLSQILQKAEVTIHNSFICGALPDAHFPVNQFCTYDNNKGGYRGDIGGPLICNDVVCGVLSNTRLFNNRTSLVGGYVEVSRYLDWIEENTGIVQPPTERTTLRPTTPTTTTLPTTTTPTTTAPTTTTQETPEPSSSETTTAATTSSEGNSSANPTTTTSEDSNTTNASSTASEDSGTTIPGDTTSTTPQGDGSSTTPDSAARPTFTAGLTIVLVSFLVSTLNT